MSGQGIFSTSLAHNEYLGNNDTKFSYSSCCTVVRFPHKDTYTQQTSILTVQHSDSFLLIKWK